MEESTRAALETFFSTDAATDGAVACDRGDSRRLAALRATLLRAPAEELRATASRLASMPRKDAVTFAAALLAELVEIRDGGLLSDEAATRAILASLTGGKRPRVLLISDFDATVLGGYYDYLERAFFRAAAASSALCLSSVVLIPMANVIWAAYALFCGTKGAGKDRPEYDYRSTLPLRQRLLTSDGFPLEVGLWTLLLHMQTITLGYDFALCTGHLDLGAAFGPLMDRVGLLMDMAHVRSWTRTLYSQWAFEACRNLGLVAAGVAAPSLPDERLARVKGDKGPHALSLYGGSKGDTPYARCVFLDDTESRLAEVRAAFAKHGLAEKLALVDAAPPAVRHWNEQDRTMTRCQGTCAEAYAAVLDAYAEAERNSTSAEYVLVNVHDCEAFVDALAALLQAPSRDAVAALLRAKATRFLVPAEWWLKQLAAKEPRRPRPQTAMAAT